jgi:hypothetical protein
MTAHTPLETTADQHPLVLPPANTEPPVHRHGRLCGRPRPPAGAAGTGCHRRKQIDD